MKRYLFGSAIGSLHQHAKNWLLDNDFVEVQDYGSPIFGVFADIHAIKADKAGVTEVLVRVIPREGNEPSQEREAIAVLLSWKLQLPTIRKIVVLAPPDFNGDPGLLQAYDEIVKVS